MDTQQNQDPLARSRELYRQQHYISDIKDIPAYQHYAVLVNKTCTYVDPYEDTNSSHSLTNTISEPYLEYVYFETEDALKDWMTHHDKFSTKYVVMRVAPIKVNINFSFEEMK
jgi:hypothetical protein